MLGVFVIIVALLNFQHIRGAIEAETFHLPIRFAIPLTILTSLIDLLPVVYLLLPCNKSLRVVKDEEGSLFSGESGCLA